MELILASTSRYRRALLATLNLPFDCISPGVNERDQALQGLDPYSLATFLADEKANAVFESYPEAAVIGSDQVVSVDGLILGKPGSVDAASEQLRLLAGRGHEIITAVTVRSQSGVMRHLDVSKLTMRALEAREIAAYVELDAPLDCAGAYKLESHGAALFERVETRDRTAITGLPLLALTEMLRGLGFEIA
jgi:septum formation protein